MHPKEKSFEVQGFKSSSNKKDISYPNKPTEWLCTISYVYAIQFFPTFFFHVI